MLFQNVQHEHYEGHVRFVFRASQNGIWMQTKSTEVRLAAP